MADKKFSPTAGMDHVFSELTALKDKAVEQGQEVRKFEVTDQLRGMDSKEIRGTLVVAGTDGEQLTLTVTVPVYEDGTDTPAAGTATTFLA